MPGSDRGIYYKRSRFSTWLPEGRLYTASHQWMAQESPGIWRVGFTQFATRVLGEMVEFGFDVKDGEVVDVGQVIGWVEGFKALSDLYCVLSGNFAGANPALETDITLLDSDPYQQGWMYRVQGEPDPQSVDTQGYTRILDHEIPG